MSPAGLWVALLLAQTVGPEASFGTPTLAAAAGNQDFPSLAACGPGYLLAWTDRRADDSVELLFVSRLAPDGTVKDTDGVHLSADTHDLRSVSVTCGSQVALVSWVDGVRDELRAERVDPATLAVLDPLPLPVSPQGMGVGGAHVAFDGTDFVVAFNDDGSYPDVYATRVSEQGTLVDPTPWTLASGPGDQFSGQLACSSGTCLATWRDEQYDLAGDVYGALVANGAITVPAFPIAAGDGGASTPSVAVGPASYLVVWPDSRVGAQDIFASRVSLSGVVLDPAGIALHTPTGASETGARAAWDGTQFQVAWTTQNFSLRATRVDPSSGAVLDLDAGVRLRAASVNALDLAPRDGGGTFLAWTEAPGLDTDLFGSGLDTGLALAVDGGALLTRSGSAQRSGALAAGAGELLVSWEDTRLGSSRVLASRVDLNGTPLDGDGFVFTANPGPERHPAVAYGAGEYLVAFQEDSSNRIWARRYSPDAGLLDVAPLTLSAGGGATRWGASAAFNGNRFLVVWTEQTANDDVVGTVLNADGTVAVPPFPIASGAGDQLSPTVAAVGTTFQVLWVGSTGYPWYSVFAGRVSDTGALQDGPGGVNVIGQTIGLDQLDQLALSCEASRCLLAYRVNGYELFAYWLEGGRPIAPALRLGGLGYAQSDPTLVFDGTQWQAAYADYVLPAGAGLAAQTVPYAPGQPSVPRLLVGDRPIRSPSLAVLGPGRLAVSYSAFDDSPQVEADRLYLRLLYSLAKGASCTADAQCTTSHCVSGVCCDSACSGGLCQTCAAAQGASADGTCTLLDASHTCRPQYSSCDVAEACDGVSGACPADAHAPDTTACDATGTCTQGVCIGGVTPPATDAGPGFSSLPGSTVRCGDSFHYGGGGPQVSGPGPVTYALAAGPDESLPEGLTVDASNGELSWVPRRDQAGTWHPVLIAQGNGWNAGQALTIEVFCPQLPRSVGCATFPGGLGALALLWALRRNAPRNRRD